jgi:hypothetical protein
MAAKKKAKKKATRATVSAGISVPKLELSLALDDKKVAAIQRCLAKGQLTIKLTRVDLLTGRAGDPYIYD